jgi:hypothetical protein
MFKAITVTTCALLLSMVCLSTDVAVADSSNGVNSVGDQLPIGAGGSTVLTLTGSTKSSVFAGSVSIGATTQGCTAANAGSMRYNASTNQFEGCNGKAWAALGGKPTLAATESIRCSIGAGESPTDCAYIRTGSTKEVVKTSASVHDLCTINLAAGWAGGFWGQCYISGTPGGTWTIDTANYQNQQITCSATCYDFQ